MLIAIMYSVVRSLIDFAIIMMKKVCSNDEFGGDGLKPYAQGHIRAAYFM